MPVGSTQPLDVKAWAGTGRLYPPETVTVLRVIEAAQPLGFNRSQVAELLAAAGHGSSTNGLPERARDKLTEVE